MGRVIGHHAEARSARSFMKNTTDMLLGAGIVREGARAAQSYGKLLEDVRWKVRRFNILCRDGWACVRCGCTDRMCDVHHKYYNGSLPWDYPDDALESLCHKCHGKEHGIITILQDASQDGAWLRRRAQGLLVMLYRDQAANRGVKDVR